MSLRWDVIALVLLLAALACVLVSFWLVHPKDYWMVWACCMLFAAAIGVMVRADGGRC